MFLAGSAARPAPAHAQTLPAPRAAVGRFTILADPRDATLARTLLDAAVRNDTFPGLPRPHATVVIVIAPDQRRFRAWVGRGAPEWGSAFAVPAQQRIYMQGRDAGSDAGDPVEALRHELAHLALHEAMGSLPPPWFDEGYASFAAGEWGREDVLATNVALAFGEMPSLDSLDAGFTGGAGRAGATYALAYRAVAELAALDPERGLTLFFRYWKTTGSLDRAVRAAYGMTLADFEHVWRVRTRRRYGGLAIVSDVTLGAAILLLIAVPLTVIRRRRDRRRMAALVAADAEAERRARESAIEQLLRSLDSPGNATRDIPPPGGASGETR